MENKFIELNKINVSGKVESKNGLSYLSWAWAWAEFLKVCPTAQYEIKKFDNLPYVYDDKTGYMVFTTVTVGDSTYEMWLPVMDNANNAMKAAPYTFKTKYKEVFVNAATMMDINKTIMRCLTKNIAMFGLGLYIYAGEDLPEGEEKEQDVKPKAKPTAVSKVDTFNKYKGLIERMDINIKDQIDYVNANLTAWLTWAEKNYNKDYADQLQTAYDKKFNLNDEVL